MQVDTCVFLREQLEFIKNMEQKKNVTRAILITNKMAKTLVLLSYFSDYSPSRKKLCQAQGEE